MAIENPRSLGDYAVSHSGFPDPQQRQPNSQHGARRDQADDDPRPDVIVVGSVIVARLSLGWMCAHLITGIVGFAGESTRVHGSGSGVNALG
jgi:hypothetical protein